MKKFSDFIQLLEDVVNFPSNKVRPAVNKHLNAQVKDFVAAKKDQEDTRSADRSVEDSIHHHINTLFNQAHTITPAKSRDIHNVLLRKSLTLSDEHPLRYAISTLHNLQGSVHNINSIHFIKHYLDNRPKFEYNKQVHESYDDEPTTATDPKDKTKTYHQKYGNNQPTVQELDEEDPLDHDDANSPIVKESTTSSAVNKTKFNILAAQGEALHDKVKQSVVPEEQQKLKNCRLSRPISDQ